MKYVVSRTLFALALLAAACGVGRVGAGAAPAASAPDPVLPAQPATDGGTPAAATATGADAAASAATIVGTVGGRSLQPVVALWGIGRTPDGQRMLAVKISDQADECARMAAQTIHASSTSLWLRVVGDNFAGAAATVPATATADTPSATFYALDASCHNGVDDGAAWASGGQISMQLLANNQVMGQFNLSMGSAATPLSGTFTAVACPAIGALIAQPDAVRSCQ